MKKLRRLADKAFEKIAAIMDADMLTIMTVLLESGFVAGFLIFLLTLLKVLL